MNEVTGVRPKRHAKRSVYRNEEPQMGKRKRGRPRRLVVPTCTIDGCPDPQQARTWCWRHLQRYYRHGDPKIVTGKK